MTSYAFLSIYILCGITSRFTTMMQTTSSCRLLDQSSTISTHGHSDAKTTTALQSSAHYRMSRLVVQSVLLLQLNHHSNVSINVFNIFLSMWWSIKLGTNEPSSLPIWQINLWVIQIHRASIIMTAVFLRPLPLHQQIHRQPAQLLL